MREIDAEVLSDVLVGVEINVVELERAELRLHLADGDRITVRAPQNVYEDSDLPPDLRVDLDTRRDL